MAAIRDGATLLLAYLKQRDISQRAFAAEAGVPPTTVTRATSRVRAMDIYSAAKIEKATGGEVPAASWALVKIRPSEDDKAA